MSERAKLSQHTAILLERARRFDISDEALLAAKDAGDTSALQPAAAEYYEYDDFFTYAESHGEQLVRAIREGYRITFNTNNGLKVWLRERFGVEAGRDFEAAEGRVIGLKLPAAEVDYLRSTVASNWVLQETEEAAEEGQLVVNLIIGALLQA